MTPKDFKDSLSEPIPREETEEFLALLKTASFAGDVFKRGMETVAKNKAELLASAVGAGVAAGLQYAGSKSGKELKHFEQALASSDKKMKTTVDAGKEPSFSEEMGHEITKFQAGIAKPLHKHPGKGALLAIPLGAAVGRGILSLGKSVIKG